MNWISKFAGLALIANLLNAQECCPVASCKQYEGKCAYLYSSAPCLNDGCNPCGLIWNLDVSLLAWQAKEDGLAFAFNTDRIEPASFAAQDFNGEYINLDFAWEPAVKVNLALGFPGRSWDLDVRWTYFNGHSDRSVSANVVAGQTGLIPLWQLPTGINLTTPLFANAKGTWELKLNQIDIELGYLPFLTPNLSIRLDAGIKGLFMDQDFRVKATNGVTSGNTTYISSELSVDSDIWGIGSRIGFDSKWRLGRGFALLSTFAGSLPLCQMKFKRTDTEQQILTGVNSPINSFYKQSFWTFRPILEASLGLSWDRCFGCNQQYNFGVAANYEMQSFWEYNMIPVLVNADISYLPFESRGNLFLQGLTLTFHFGY